MQEAQHLLLAWGFDLSPACANLSHLSRYKCPLVATTGTCTTRTEEVILTPLNISDASRKKLETEMDKHTIMQALELCIFHLLTMTMLEIKIP